MDIILFRHGPAGSRDPARWPDDSLRPLTSDGEEKTRRAAQGLARVLPEVDVILTSPLVRAEQTAQALLAATDGQAKLETFDALAPGGAARELLARLGKLDEGSVAVLVGHEPNLGELAGRLVLGGRASLPLKKAGACCLRFEGTARAGEAELLWLLPPKQLRKLGGKAKKP